MTQLEKEGLVLSFLVDATPSHPAFVRWLRGKEKIDPAWLSRFLPSVRCTLEDFNFLCSVVV